METGNGNWKREMERNESRNRNAWSIVIRSKRLG